MSNDVEFHAAPRQRLLAVSAALLDGLYDARAVQVLSTLRPADMHPGGARVPGTSYELDAPLATRAMQGLLALRQVQADALTVALAQADQLARYAMLAGQPPPTLATLYPHCTREINAPGSDSLDGALQALQDAAARLFTPTQGRRIAALCAQWRELFTRVDALPVQQFIAAFVRNAP